MGRRLTERRMAAERDYDILIIGGGQAGRRAAEGARSAAPEARIGILCEEDSLPYDRPGLSKRVLETGGDLEGIEPRNAASYRADRIDLFLNDPAHGLDHRARTVVSASGTRLGYRKLVLATGSRPRTLPTPFGLADRVFSLRTKADAVGLARRLQPGARIVIIGAGVIGLEAAAAAVARGARVAVLETSDRAMGRSLPAEISETLMKRHRQAGVALHFGVRFVRFETGEADGALCVATDQGGFVADTVVVGIGVAANLALAEDAGLAVEAGVLVDATGAASVDDVFAAGEVAQHPAIGHERPVRLEMWQTAELQAHAAGRTAAGAPTGSPTLPWFWTDQYGGNLQVLGDALGGSCVVRRGGGEAEATWFVLDDHRRLRGAVAWNRGRDIALARRLFTQDRPFAPDQLADESAPLRQLLT